MNMFKKNGGFTLVELIVVIAILAILAGVTVPAYTSYINKAKEVDQMVKDRASDMAEEANGYLDLAEDYYTFSDIDDGV